MYVPIHIPTYKHIYTDTQILTWFAFFPQFNVPFSEFVRIGKIILKARSVQEKYRFCIIILQNKVFFEVKLIINLNYTKYIPFHTIF